MMTQDERNALDAAYAVQQLQEFPEKYRKELEVSVIEATAGVQISTDDKTAARIFRAAQYGQTVFGWRAENGVFDLSPTQLIEIDTAIVTHIAKVFAAQAVVENNLVTYNTIEEAKAAFDALM